MTFDSRTMKYKHGTEDGNPYQIEARGNIIRHFHPRNPGEIWMTTYNGLGVLDTEREEIVVFYENDYFKGQVFGVNFIDKQQNIYTWGRYDEFGNKGGVYYLHIYSPLKNQVQYFDYKPSIAERFLLTRDYLELQQDSTMLIVGQYSEGLCQINLKTGKWEVYPPSTSDFDPKDAFQSWSITKLNTGEILLLDDNYIYQWEESTRQLVYYAIQPNLTDPQLRKITTDFKGDIWLGSHYHGPIRIDPRSGQIDYFAKEKEKPGMKDHLEAVWDIAVDRNNNVWLRASKGFSVYHSELDTFYHFPFVVEGSSFKSHVQDLETDALGRVWINTHGLDALGITDPDQPQKGIVHWHRRDDGLQQADTYFFNGRPQGPYVA